MKDEATNGAVDDPRLLAYALGELEGEELREVEALLAASPAAREEVEAVRAFAARLEEELAGEQGSYLLSEQRLAIMEKIEGTAPKPSLGRSALGMRQFGILLAGAAATVVVILHLGSADSSGEANPFVHRMGDNERRASSAERDLEDLTKHLQKLAYGGQGGVQVAPSTGSPQTVGSLETLGYAPPTVDELVLRELEGLGYVGDDGPTFRATEQGESFNTERYDHVPENGFVAVADDPLSTFSIDVDTASYANVRRFLLREGRRPPVDAVRIEELVNYFDYAYAEPEPGQPFSVNVEVAPAPWRPEHRLVRIGLKGRAVQASERGNANLVFLIDVSGSMNSPDKLPLLVEALSMLVGSLDPSDRVAIVVYAGSSGLVLDSTPCSEGARIQDALRRLRSGGSTNGGAGIQLAYRVAREHFVEGGVNRVILATDGDFNVGTTGQGPLVRLIEDQAASGVYLSVLGFGRGNLNDATMESLADEGNGNYGYVDSLREARKLLVEQVEGTLVTIAKDVKIQVEFNPAEVTAYRLIGYENRALAHREFNDDTKDAGEIGAGHTVTALYEVVPRGVPFEGPSVNPLRYQQRPEPRAGGGAGELLTVKLRHKPPVGGPGDGPSEMLEVPVRDGGRGLAQASEDFRFAAAVASFGMLLRGSAHGGSASWELALRLAREGQGPDPRGYRAEFQQLVLAAERIVGP